MSWRTYVVQNQLWRRWPRKVVVECVEYSDAGERSAVTRSYVPEPKPAKRHVSSVHDGVGQCTCGECGKEIGTTDRYCRHCGSMFDGTLYGVSDRE